MLQCSGEGVVRWVTDLCNAIVREGVNTEGLEEELDAEHIQRESGCSEL